ncbi:MAG: hypothetical protein MZV70_17975 [Desulfobacterales bacterium]|nr:hypothetical protein [Desulfobacterales bacterium]
MQQVPPPHHNLRHPPLARPAPDPAHAHASQPGHSPDHVPNGRYDERYLHGISRNSCPHSRFALSSRSSSTPS